MKNNTNKVFSTPMLKIKPIYLCVSVILGFASVAHGAIINTNGAGVQVQPNGPTIVNINKASDKGVSHNIYHSFDVDPTGVILNNSKDSSTTQLGGTINGNANLAGGSAKVILNEVNSNRASTLNGLIEVAGDKAQVIVANPSGITCNSCGFINTSRATLTTGNAVKATDGTIVGYNVEKGQIIVNGALRSDSPTDLLARSVAIRGDIRAKEINITTGSNFVDADNRFTTAIRGIGSTSRVGIDTSSIGGMYADKITLVTTENGVGVTNNGVISAGTGGLVINSAGQVTNTGLKIESQGKINIKAASTITNRSSIAGNSDIDITTSGYGYIDNQKGQIVSNGGNVKLATLNSINNNNGIVSAFNTIDTQSGSVANTNGTIQTRTGDININTTGAIVNSFDLRNNLHEQNRRGIISGRDINISSNQLTNNYGNISAERNMDIRNRLEVRNNGKATLQSKGSMNIDSSTINNLSSTIKAGGDMNITTTTLNNDNVATINGEKNLNVKSSRLTNTGSIVFENGKANISATALSNQYGYIKANEIEMTSDSLNNQSGYIHANKSLTVDSGTIYNRYSDNFKQVSSRFGLINQSGGLESGDGGISIKANSFDNQYGLVFANITQKAKVTGDINVTVRNDFQNNRGTVRASNNMNITVGNMTNTYGLIDAGNSAMIKSFKSVNNQYGTIRSVNTTQIDSPTIYSQRNGQILGGTVVLNTLGYY
nr:filamentous hemagglutinin N-terminal domain-containing protein [Providencia stuartii]ELR5081452.1 filamentous hemagglutinin N-terminal domain-containing protein [Providencia stuartii]